MARSIWKGSLTFGLVNIPVSLFAGESREEIGFTLLDKRNMSPIGYKKVNKKTGEEVSRDDVIRGYELEKGEFVTISDDDLKRASPERTQRIEIQAFVDAGQLDPAYFDKPYYLEPSPKSEKVYALLREVLKRTSKIGIAAVVVRAREYLAAVIPQSRMLELCLLRYAYELRSPDDLHLPDEDVEKLHVSESELKMAERLVQDLAAPWKPESYKDRYREELLSFIKKKAEAGKVEEVVLPKPGKVPEAPEDIMALLKQSVAKAETTRGRGAPKGRYLH